MNLSLLINELKVIQAVGDVGRVNVSSIAYDSRKVCGGSLFVAIKGFKTDGHNYIERAINQGAVAILVEELNPQNLHLTEFFRIPIIVVKNSRRALAELSHRFLNYPSKSLKMIGITGTNGKTTSTYILKSILEAAGFKTGLIGTIKNLIGDKELITDKTTPESLELAEIFQKMKEENCTYCVMEVSSHALELERVAGIQFSGAIFTNLTQDHLDFHSDFEHYFNAKKKLFDGLDYSAVAVSNFDNEYGNPILKDTKARKISFGKNKNYNYSFEDIDYNFNKIKFKINNDYNRIEIESSLSGNFNIYNISGVVALACELGIDKEIIKSAINSMPPVPGRFQTIEGKTGPKVIVDYSHTPDALENCLKTIIDIKEKKNDSTGKVVVVFGAGGDRDRTKRPVMGKVVEKYADSIILTNDNPRTEDPVSIIDEINSGITDKTKVKIIYDREEAIKYAITTSDECDIVLIGGKGHENYQDVNGVKIHFDDSQVAAKYLNREEAK